MSDSIYTILDSNIQCSRWTPATEMWFMAEVEDSQNMQEVQFSLIGGVKNVPTSRKHALFPSHDDREPRGFYLSCF